MENFGEWIITAVDATGVKGSDLFSKADLYVIIKFGGKTVKTKTAKNQEFPTWEENFSFPCQNNNNNNNSSVEVTVMDDNLFKDDKLTAAYINFSQFPAVGEEKEYSIPLSHKNKDVGILHLRIKNNSRVNNFNNNNNNKLSSNVNNLGGYDNTVLGGHSYANNNNNLNNNLNNDYNNSNKGHEFYHNVTETHYAANQFISPNQNITNNDTARLQGYNNNNNNNNNNYSNLNNNIPMNKLDNVTTCAPSSSSSSSSSSSPSHHHSTAIPPTIVGDAAITNDTLTKPNSIPKDNFTTSSTHHSLAHQPVQQLVQQQPVQQQPVQQPVQQPATTTETTTKRIKKKHRVRLPEKHHHYEDGFTSSSSESSNEGEKRRLGQQNYIDDTTTTTTTTKAAANAHNA